MLLVYRMLPLRYIGQCTKSNVKLNALTLS